MQRKTSSRNSDPSDHLSNLERLVWDKSRFVPFSLPRKEISVEELFKDYRRRYQTSPPEEPALSLEKLQAELIGGMYLDDVKVTLNPYKDVVIFERIPPLEIVERVLELTEGNIRPALAKQLSALSGFQFEKVVAEILRCVPWVREVAETMLTADGGVDFKARVALPGRREVVLALGQVKRTQAKTGSPSVRNFVGSLVSHHPKPKIGVFVSLSGFTEPGKHAVGESPIRIQMVDGAELTQWLLDFEVGTLKRSFTLHSLDQGFWSEIHETYP